MMMIHRQESLFPLLKHMNCHLTLVWDILCGGFPKWSLALLNLTRPFFERAFITGGYRIDEEFCRKLRRILSDIPTDFWKISQWVAEKNSSRRPFVAVNAESETIAILKNTAGSSADGDGSLSFSRLSLESVLKQTLIPNKTISFYLKWKRRMRFHFAPKWRKTCLIRIQCVFDAIKRFSWIPV